MEWVYDDGGRSQYFKAEHVGDCVCRAIAIATGKDYRQVYDDINRLAKKERTGKRKRGVSSARNGVYKGTIKKLMAEYGWTWHPTMQIGSGCTTHLRASELPMGRLLVSVSRHETAVIDGVLHDTYDCSRDGTRCVYGYWTEGVKTEPLKCVPTMGHEEFVKALEAVREDFEGGYMTEREFAQQCERLAHERSGRPYRRDA
jgi:hypothetical protein